MTSVVHVYRTDAAVTAVGRLPGHDDKKRFVLRRRTTSLRSVIALSTHAHARIALAVIMFGAPNNWFVVVVVFTAAWHLTLPIAMVWELTAASAEAT